MDILLCKFPIVFSFPFRFNKIKINFVLFLRMKHILLHSRKLKENSNEKRYSSKGLQICGF